MSHTKIHQLLTEYGQSPWVDNIRRGMFASGEMQRLIDQGIVGVTANPTIFEKAIGGSSDYDEAIDKLARTGAKTDDIYEAVAVEDIQTACDLFHATWEQTKHVDGRVSLEVLPELAHETQQTAEQAQRYWSLVNRPNLLVKIPATLEGIAAIEESIYHGVSVNVTLIFGLERYRAVMDAYMRGLERRAAGGEPINEIFSVASFFVSRVDTLVDKKLDELLKETTDPAKQQEIKSLKGKAAIANAKLAYAEFQQMFSGARWEALKAQGANCQRPLWASTSTKNPDYPDTMYVDELIGPDTVDTMPPATIEAFADHGHLARTVDQNVDDARRCIERLAALGIQMDAVTEQLEVEGVKTFFESFEKLRQTIQQKRGALVGSRGS